MVVLFGAYPVPNVILDWDCLQYVEVIYPQHKKLNANPVPRENSQIRMTQPPARTVTNA